MELTGAAEPILATDCNLSGTRTEKARLCGVRLSGADLSGTTIDDCTLTGMRTDGIEVETLLAAYRKTI